MTTSTDYYIKANAKANLEISIRNFRYSQVMLYSALLFMVLIISGCQTQSGGMDTSVTSLSDATAHHDQDSGNHSDTGDGSIQSASSALNFTEGFGYEITWPLEERFIVSPPEHLRALMVKTCMDSGYITPYITTITFENGGIKAYFLCRGFGG